MLAWKDICEDRSLRDLPFKIETNRFDQIVMSSTSNWRGALQTDIGVILGGLMNDGRTITSCAV